MEDKKLYEKFINYESALASLFKELGLKENQCQLIRAFMLVSKGESVFEASFSDLGNVFHKKNPKARVDSKARNAFKGLEKWQNENQMQLINILKQGEMIHDKKSGKIDYIKSKYEFVILDELVKFLYSDTDNLEGKIQEIVNKIKAHYEPVDRFHKCPPLNKLEMAKKTIITKGQRIFEYAKKAGLNPRREAEKLINTLSNFLNSLILEDEYRQNSQKFIKDFEQLLDMKNITKESVTE